MKWAKLKEGRKFELAHLPFFIDGASVFTPTEAQYRERGYLPFVDERPTEEGYTFAPLDTATERDGVLYRDYERKELPPPVPPVTRYSKLKLITAAKKRGKWDALKAFITNAGLWDEWLVCQYLASNYEGFDEIKAAIVSEGIATAEEVDAILAASVDEEVR